MPYCGIFVAQLNMSETHLRAEQMTHLAHGITLSGWILVAVLNTGPLVLFVEHHSMEALDVFAS